MKVHPLIHFLVKNAIRIALALIFVGIPLAILYLREVGIGFGAKEALGSALSNKTMEVKIGRLALDPFAGLLARDILLYERPSGRLLANISNIALSLNLSELMARRLIIDKLALEHAAVSIPLEAGEDAPHLEIKNIHAEMIFLGDQVRLSRFDGNIEGIEVQLTGQFLNPKALLAPGAGPQAQGAAHYEMISRAFDIFRKIRYPYGPPLLHAHLEADFADMKSLHITDLTMRAKKIRTSDWALNDIELKGEFTNGVLKISRFTAHDKTGSLEASADYAVANRAIDVSIFSTLQPQQFLQELAKKSPIIHHLIFNAPPQVEARLTIDLASDRPAIRIMGMAHASELAFKGVNFRDLSFSFALKDDVFYARDVRLRADKGSLTGNIWFAPDDFRLALQNSIPPPLLSSLFDPKTREFLDKMEFKDLPDISISLRGDKPDFANIQGSGHLKLGRTAIRGSWLDSAESTVEIKNRCATYRNFQIIRGEGKATGTFAYDVGLQEVRLDGVRSTIMPKDVLTWIDPKIAEAISPYRFRGAPSVTAQGMVHLKDAKKNKLSLTVDSSAGLNYDLLGRTLQFGKTSALVSILGAKVNATVRNAELMGGNVSLNAIVSIDAADPTFGANIKLNRINFAELTKLYFNYVGSKGMMSGSYKFDARMGQEQLMRGEGSLRVENGNVFAIPILGPFSDILSSILPGVGYHNARVASADFRIADEMINTKDLVIEGTGFSMMGSGNIYFMTGKLDMSMRINAKGLPGLVFYPVSKLLFEYVSTGTISRPAWRPKIIPRFKNNSENRTNQQNAR